MALGVLLLARGIEMEEDGAVEGAAHEPRACRVRLSVSGVNWQMTLALHERRQPAKTRGAVLQFVLDAYRRHRDSFGKNRDDADGSGPPEDEHGVADSVDLEPVLTERESSETNVATDDMIAERPLIHKPWPGSDSWHNWAVGVDVHGVWHLFHYHRSGDATATYSWRHHRRARVEITAGRMDDVARQFAANRSLPAATGAEIDRLKPIISRLRSALRQAVKGEGHRPKGNPILPPTTRRPAYRAEIKFGTVERRDRHFAFHSID